jgi:hypothetical protein
MAGTKLEARTARGRGRVPALAPWMAVAFCLAAAGSAGAGSIFMKNGYIIQGPIVEHSDGGEGSIVLGWPNGKVTIYRRFVERVDFEPGEEKTTKVADVQATPVTEEVIITPGNDEELPQSLTELVKIYKLPQSLVEGHEGAPPPSGVGQQEGATPGTPVDVVPPPHAGDGSTAPPPRASRGRTPPSRRRRPGRTSPIAPPTRAGDSRSSPRWAGRSRRSMAASPGPHRQGRTGSPPA